MNRPHQQELADELNRQTTWNFNCPSRTTDCVVSDEINDTIVFMVADAFFVGQPYTDRRRKKAFKYENYAHIADAVKDIVEYICENHSRYCMIRIPMDRVFDTYEKPSDLHEKAKKQS